jgi:hypothetical protein
VGNALSNSNVTGAEEPALVVLDEVDGVDGDGAVEFLIQMLTTDKPRMTRPVVAICNDLYASALRPLKSKACVVRMDAVRLERLMVCWGVLVVVLVCLCLLVLRVAFNVLYELNG